jgi:hypothetical protein
MDPFLLAPAMPAVAKPEVVGPPLKVLQPRLTGLLRGIEKENLKALLTILILAIMIVGTLALVYWEVNYGGMGYRLPMDPPTTQLPVGK